MNKHLISESEKNRILEMHKSRTMKHYLFEDPITTKTTTIKELPEITISAWMPLKSAMEQAKEKNGDILVYVYNDGCSACSGFTKNLMQNQKYRNFIKINKLTLSKVILCAEKGYEDYSNTETGISGKFTPCDEKDISEYQKFKQKFGINGIPVLLIISADGYELKSELYYGGVSDQETVFERMIKTYPKDNTSMNDGY